MGKTATRSPQHYVASGQGDSWARAGILVLTRISGSWPCELGPGTGAGDMVYGQGWQGVGKGWLPGRGSGVGGLLSGQTLHPPDHGEADACTATYTSL